MQHAPTMPHYEHRPTFIMKVMGYVALAFALMTVGVFVGPQIFPPTVGQGAFIGIWVVALVMIYFSHKWANLPRPWNFVVYCFFALLTGVMVYPTLMYALAVGGVGIIATALGATTLMALAAGVYAVTTKRDLSGWGGFLMMAVIGLILVGVLQIFFFSNTVEMISAGIGVLVFSAFIAYDIQMLKRYPEDRAMEAGIALYLSLFNLFMSILRLILAFNRR